MKCKAIIFIVLFSFISKVNASTYYGSYRKVDDIGNYNNDTLMIDSYKLYNTYNVKYRELGYILDNDLYIKDEEDYIEKLIEVDKIEGDEYIELNYNKEFIDKFLLYLPLNIEINEIEVYNKDKKIEYSVFNPPMFGTGNIEKLYDNDYNSVYKHTFDSRMALWITETNLNDIKIIIYTNKSKDFDFKISFENGTKDISFDNKVDRKHIIIPKYSEQDGISYKYKTYKKLYKYYEEEKEILNNYVREGNNIILDDYLEISDFYVKDKLSLTDNLIIDKEGFDINNFILESTDDVLINCNINYEVNGLYKCNFILNDINVEKEVKLDIPRTNQETINEPNLENEFLLNIPNNEEETINENNLEIKTNIEENEVDNINDEIIYIEDEIEYKKIDNEKENSSDIEVEKINTTKNKEKKLNKKNINEKEVRKSNILNIVKYIILFNLIIIEIILFIRKRKRNNVERV